MSNFEDPVNQSSGGNPNSHAVVSDNSDRALIHRCPHPEQDIERAEFLLEQGEHLNQFRRLSVLLEHFIDQSSAVPAQRLAGFTEENPQLLCQACTQTLTEVLETVDHYRSMLRNNTSHIAPLDRPEAESQMGGYLEQHSPEEVLTSVQRGFAEGVVDARMALAEVQLFLRQERELVEASSVPGVLDVLHQRLAVVQSADELVVSIAELARDLTVGTEPVLPEGEV